MPSPAFSWTNYQNNSFLSGSTTVNIGSTNANVASGTINAGNILIANLQINGETTDTITPPTGWVQIGTIINDGTNCCSFWYKIAGAGETGSYTFSWVNSHFFVWSLCCYTGANTSTPIDVASVATVSSGGGTTVTLASISPTHSPDVLIVNINNAVGLAALTTPGDLTSRAATPQNSSGAALNIADKALSVSGATGTEVFSGATAGNNYFTMMLALQPSAGAGSSTPARTLTGVGV